MFKDVMAFGRKADRRNRLDPSLASLAAMAAAVTVGCGFCLDFGYFMVHNKGLDEAKAREVPRWRDSHAFSGNVALGIRSQGFSASCGLRPLAAPSPEAAASA
jgi:AhpD family alkylhydroperoxidase